MGMDLLIQPKLAQFAPDQQTSCWMEDGQIDGWIEITVASATCSFCWDRQTPKVLARLVANGSVRGLDLGRVRARLASSLVEPTVLFFLFV